MTGQSMNPQAELLAKLMKEMPEIFAEGKIDTRKLKETLGEDVIADQERYGLTWAGKAECFKRIQETTTNTLKPCREESVDFDNSENLFIEGDNLQVLKVLQKSYYGKVKMIYIDPPYNTGNDFIYNDKFSRTKREELIANGSLDEDGNIVNHDLYRQNTRDSGHFHSNWLNMMYPRLFLARNLLRQDGVIFVSIDDNEVKNLRAMMDEIFGEENFVEQVIWKNKYGSGALTKGFANVHEYVLCYTRSPLQNIEAPLSDEAIDAYKSKDSKFSVRGGYITQPLSTTSKDDRPNLRYAIEHNGHQILPDKQWIWSKERFEEAYKNDEIVINETDGKFSVRAKQYLRDVNGKMRLAKPISILNGPFNQEGTKELKELDLSKLFDFPKPTALIKYFLSFVINSTNSENDIFLDFFAGSGTTAHAVMQLNSEDGGNRKWICVQLPEKCKEESEAAKAGFATIADIAKERIRRAGKKIRSAAKDKKLDLGFKAFKLDETNFKIWNTQIENVAQLEQQLMDFVDNVKPEALTENLLYELIIKSGLELNVPIEEKKAKDGAYYRIGNGDLIIGLVDKLTQSLFDAILADKPEKIIVLDRAFANNDQLKTNMLLSAEHAGVKEFKVI